jgi:DNA repair protein SbcC/Rad50
MRILGVRFQNLNSLAGEWQIDLTHPDYTSNGIFAITGPTGSGKTTILDAISLGLYGRTPRLDKVTKTTNEIMSRQAGGCFAEVTFETQRGRFRCHWSQHRSRKKPDGELQPAKHEIADVQTGEILENKLNAVAGVVENVTGMDFDRFTRSMLLAQGGFAAFLSASPDKRAPILEQITGTEIYSNISIKVHERSREESEKLDLLQAELQGVKILTDEEETRIQTGLQEKQSRENGMTEMLNGLRRALAWMEGIALLEKELAVLESKAQEWERRHLAFEPEAIKLDKARRSFLLEGAYKEVAAFRRHQETDADALEKTKALLPDKEKGMADAGAARDQAAQLLQESKTRQAAEAETLKKVRELDARLAEKKKQIDEADKALAGMGRQVKSFQDGIGKTNLALKQSQEDLETVCVYLTGHAADEALTVHLSGIMKSFAALGDTEFKYGKIGKDLTAVAGKKEKATAALKKIKVDHEKSRADFEKKQTVLAALANDVQVILKGREPARWRSDLDALRERSRLLLQVSERLAQIDAHRKTLEGLSSELKTFQTERERMLTDVKEAALRKAALEKDAENMETQVALLARIRALEEERKCLEDGKPCPLCGSTDHPFARGNVPELNQAEAALKKLKAEFKKASSQHAKLETDLAKKDAEIGHVEKNIAEKQSTMKVDEEQCAQCLRALNLPVGSEESAVCVKDALSVVQSCIDEASAIVLSAEEKSIQEQSTRTELEKLQVKVEATGNALRDAGYQLETAENELRRLTHERDAAGEEVEQARLTALNDIAPFGIAEVPPDATAVIKELTGRKQIWETRQKEKSGHEKKIGELNASLGKDTALLESLEKEMAARCAARSTLASEDGAQFAFRRELFGDKNPDAEEKRLSKEVLQAEEALEKKREVLGHLEKEIGALKERLNVLKGNMERRAAEILRSERTLADSLRKSGLEDEADFLSARLPADQREALEAMEKLLSEEKVQLDARKKDKSEALVLQRTMNLTDQSGEALKESIGEYELKLKQVRLEIGADTKSLADNRLQKEKRQGRLHEIEAQKKECLRWQMLRELIGSADGKKFRNFAQGLTFEMMTAHANRQLQKMTDRYLLVRDACEPLELNVIDNYQAGEVRSTKNLSGGESFIVSLALALGLSQMASRNVRVDSLFLDEGFGTLDDDALETALDTLSELQQDGKLIGVISHVSALKERIGTQISVIPETSGRSTLSGPGCHRR